MQAIAGSSFVPRLSSLALKQILINRNVHLPPELMHLDIHGLGPDEIAQNYVMNNMPWPEKFAGLLKAFTFPSENEWPKTIEELDVWKHLPAPDEFKAFTDSLARMEQLAWKYLGTICKPHDVPADHVPLPLLPDYSAREALRFLPPVRNKLNEKLIRANESGLNGQSYALVRPTLKNCEIVYPRPERRSDPCMPVDLRHYVLERVDFHDLPFGNDRVQFDGAHLTDCQFYDLNMAGVEYALRNAASDSNYELLPSKSRSDACGRYTQVFSLSLRDAGPE